MIKINNEIYRNIQEQVQANKEAIEAFEGVEFTLNNFGITVLGRVDYVSDIPELDFKYGDAYLVGLYEPYNLYIYTRTNSNVGTFINMGPLNIVGQEGPAGPVGPAGKDGYAPVVRYGNGLPVTEPTDKKGYIYIDQLTSRLYTFDNGWNFVINMQGPKGDQGNQGIQGATGTTLSIVGKLASPNLLPTNFASGSIPKNSAYLVDVQGANKLYIILGEQSDYSTWYWQDAGDFNLGSVIYKDSAFQSSINITDSYNTNTGAVVTDTATNKLNNDLQTKINSKVAYSDFETELLTKADKDNAVTPSELNSAIDSTTNTLNTNINNTKSELTGLINGKQDKLNGSQTDAVNSGITQSLVSKFDQKPTLDMIYPVGSIYMSVNSTNPSTLFGGTWEQIKDRFLLSAGDSYSVGSTGGEATHTLTINEMPSHKHEFAVNQSEMGGKIVYNGPAYVTTIGVNNPAYSNGDYLPYVGLTGSDQPHNNMPPYLAVYMWKRTA